MMQNSQGVPQSLGEGIAAIGQALSARLGYQALARKEAAARATGDAAFGNIAAAMAGKSAFPAAPGSSTASTTGGQTDYHGEQLAWTDAAPYQKALLNTISGPESGGHYDVMYGGGKFGDFSHHPNQAVRIQTGPNAGRTSTAAGKYQFLGSTWDDQAKKLGLTDFSPVNQDKAAWNLAAETYKDKTGQDLATVLQSGDPQAIAGVGRALAGQWTSLPGGIEQGTNEDRFVATYQRALGAGATPAQATAVAQQQTAQPVKVASLDPSAGVAAATARPLPQEYAAKGITEEQWDAMNAPDGAVVQTKPAPATDGGYMPGAPAATTNRGKRVLAALMSRQPLGGPVASLTPAGTPAVAPTAPAEAAPPQQRIVQAMQDNLPVMAGGDAGAIQWDENGGPSMQTLMQAANSANYMNDAQRSILSSMIQNQMQNADPLRQLQIQAARKSLAAPPKQWQKLDDHTLFDPASGETRSAGGSGRPLFEGNGLDAQAWNILQTADPSSREYATAYAIVSQPKQQLVQTENGLVPVQVPPQLPAWLKAPTNEATPVAPAAPTPQPANPAAPAAPAAPSNGLKSGEAIPGTAKPPNEQQQRDNKLYSVVAPQMEIVKQNFADLSNLSDQALSAIPHGSDFGADYLKSPGYQRASNAINTIIASYLYSVSGATASPQEVEKLAAGLIPKPGEAKASIDDKLARLQGYVDAIRTGGSGAAAPAVSKGGTTSNGLKWSIEP
ncbi:MAG: hypothetical protein EOQ93_03010 [Mesorhizobium sp.]|nr:MAG: hypothetical protein EOQ93_03010 [Mesorhizobium sp.]